MLDPRTIGGLTVGRIRAELAKMRDVPPALVEAFRRDRRRTVHALADVAERTRMGRARPATDLLAHERALWERGVAHIAGVDEAGRGPLAGPVCAAAVILPVGCELAGVRDSKRLSPTRREELEPVIRSVAIAVGVGLVDVDVIDRINIYQASLKAMRLALADLAVEPEHVLVDGEVGPRSPFPETPIIGGDDSCLSIAAASIIAKVTRDRIMVEMDGRYPGYGFARHKGYGTPQHLAALGRLGPCPIHRRSFAGIGGPGEGASSARGHMARAIRLASNLDELAAVAEAIRDQVGLLAPAERTALRRLFRERRDALGGAGRTAARSAAP